MSQDETKQADKQKPRSVKKVDSKKDKSVDQGAAQEKASPDVVKSKGEKKKVAAPAEAAAETSGAEKDKKPAADADLQQVPAVGAKPPRGKKTTRHVSAGVAHINATFNNTHVTITDREGGVIAWSSGGRLGFTGTKKSSAYAATMVAQDAARQAAAYRLQEVEVRVHGPGAGRESAVRALQSAGLTISAIRDVTPIPHNGCRPRKRRRV